MEIRCTSIKKSYGERQVLDIDSLTIPRASFYGIIGPNGAGKSTFLHILGGLDDNYSGNIDYFADFSVIDNTTLLLQSAYLLRGSVYKNIEYPLKIRKTDKKKAEARVNSLLKQFDLEHLKDQSAATLSGGERQRTALARALSFSPKLILLDEPTANIDPVSTKLMESILLEEQEKGATIVLITHNLAQANRLCSHIAFLKDSHCLEVVQGENLLQSAENSDFKTYIADEVL